MCKSMCVCVCVCACACACACARARARAGARACVRARVCKCGRFSTYQRSYIYSCGVVAMTPQEFRLFICDLKSWGVVEFQRFANLLMT